MERYAYALALCASDKLGDCSLCVFFFTFLSSCLCGFFSYFIAHFIYFSTCVLSICYFFFFCIDFFLFILKRFFPTGWTNSKNSGYRFTCEMIFLFRVANSGFIAFTRKIKTNTTIFYLLWAHWKQIRHVARTFCTQNSLPLSRSLRSLRSRASAKYVCPLHLASIQGVCCVCAL